MITDVDGVTVGHWSDLEARTGCTVVRFPEGTVASGEVRGGAPATREFALLDPTMMVQRIDALVLTGGSAFGLASAHGVMEALAEAEVGFPTAGGVVPIVVAIALYDLAVGDGRVRPGPSHGRAALAAATAGPYPTGQVGAGTGATVDKWEDPQRRRPGGLVTATRRGMDGLVVSALVAVNAYGDPGGDLGHVADVLSARRPPATDAPSAEEASFAEGSVTNTTIGVVVTNAALDKTACRQVAEAAHDGLARAVAPTHTAADGDAFVVAATGVVATQTPVVRAMATAVVAEAIAELGRPDHGR